MKFVLASASPRRREILTEYGFEFDVIPSDVEEVIDNSLSPEKIVESLAFQKAISVYKKCGITTLGADTIVVLDGKILGKPKSKAHSKELLQMLSGREHLVITGFAIIGEGKQVVSHDVTRVKFNELSDEKITEYTNLGLGMDKAGGYGIQDGYDFVKQVQGSFYNVVGLPIEKVAPLLRRCKDEI